MLKSPFHTGFPCPAPCLEISPVPHSALITAASVKFPAVELTMWIPVALGSKLAGLKWGACSSTDSVSAFRDERTSTYHPPPLHRPAAPASAVSTQGERPTPIRPLCAAFRPPALLCSHSRSCLQLCCLPAATPCGHCWPLPPPLPPDTCRRHGKLVTAKLQCRWSMDREV